MKKNLLYKVILATIVATGVVNVFAQNTVTFNPAALTPADTGYYLGGVYKDKNNDGTEEFYNGCVDEYGDASHKEWGKQQGFRYERCMIMPTCTAKGSTPVVSTGYIQLTKGKYLGTDSAKLGAIYCPYMKNLTQLYLEVSPDVTPQTSRHIYFYIDFSTDYGATWSPNFIKDESKEAGKNGDIFTFPKPTESPAAFDSMMLASQTKAILIRISSDVQRVKVHKIILTGDSVAVIHDAVITYKTDIRPYNIIYSTIEAKTGTTITVYNSLGQLIGSGKSVMVPKPGIYFIKSQNGKTFKEFIQ